MLSFLQAHYNQYRDAGGPHAEYVIWNDISWELADKLKRNYEGETNEL
jgi:hypothetical protein